MGSLDRVRQGGKRSNLAGGCRGRDNTKQGRFDRAWQMYRLVQGKLMCSRGVQGQELSK